MTHLKLQLGDAEDEVEHGSLAWVTINLSLAEFKEASDKEVVERYLLPALMQLVREARYRLS